MRPVETIATGNTRVGSAAANLAIRLPALQAAKMPRINHSDGSKMNTASAKYQVESNG